MQADAKPQQPPQTPHRYDGVVKVTGKAKYAAEFTEPFAKKDLLHAYIVQSTVANGTITAMDTKAAERAAGVVAVMTPFNAPKLQVGAPQPPARRNLSVLQDAKVSYNGQPIAVVVAKSLDQAVHAARLIKTTYQEAPAKIAFMTRLGEARLPKSSGKDQAVQAVQQPDTNPTGSVVIENTYVTPIQNHNPMEPHATIAWWEGEKLSVYDATQYITGSKMTFARTLNLAQDNVHVIDPYVGGGFGSKGSTWSHAVLAAMAAKITQKPVKLVLGREQMFGPVGYRPTTVNKIKLVAKPDGKLALIQQDVIINASVLEDFAEHAENPARILYSSEKIVTSLKMVDTNYAVATFMRAPGEAPGTAVFEIAMDELAEKLGMDPVQLRLVNYAEKNPTEGKPWSSKHLRECYEQAGKRFGWEKRNPKPGQMSEGNKLIGYGMATATYPANRSAASCVAKYMADGKVFVGSGTQDLGTGMYTVMAQTAAANLGLQPLDIVVKLGDSTLPKAPVSGGSQSTASVGPAVDAACTELKLKVADLAIGDKASPVFNAATTDVDVKAGRVFVKSDPNKGETVSALLSRNGGKAVQVEGSAEPGQDRTAMTSNSWGAVFAEVEVDKSTHMVKVRRVVATYDIGTLVNDKTGINQLQGGITWGVGFALHEATVIDLNTGRPVNGNLGEYHVPANADAGNWDVTALNIPDTKFSPLGARGIGEIGATGAAAAVANAIYNATGKRVRSYPITPDKLMQA